MDGKTVRACDLGYGHVKFTDGRDSESNILICERFPSYSPPSIGAEKENKITELRDTHEVTVNNNNYEVGKGIAMRMNARHESEVLNQAFSMSDDYQARLYGALSYMHSGLKKGVIDFLVLGLPLNAFGQYYKMLAEKFSGEHQINTKGDRVFIGECTVFPQPLGSYQAYLSKQRLTGDKSIPMALIVDPGYNTVDWYVCKGMVPNHEVSGVTLTGMSVILKNMAEQVIKDHAPDATIAEMVRRIDLSFTSGEKFTVFGHDIDIAPLMKKAEGIIQSTANAIKNKIGSGLDIDVIILTGGGAKVYAPFIQRQFPKNKVIILPDAAYANVRGFHLMGERLAKSAERASQAAHQITAEI